MFGYFEFEVYLRHSSRDFTKAVVIDGPFLSIILNELGASWYNKEFKSET